MVLSQPRGLFHLALVVEHLGSAESETYNHLMVEKCEEEGYSPVD